MYSAARSTGDLRHLKIDLGFLASSSKETGESEKDFALKLRNLKTEINLLLDRHIAASEDST